VDTDVVVNLNQLIKQNIDYILFSGLTIVMISLG